MIAISCANWWRVLVMLQCGAREQKKFRPQDDHRAARFKRRVGRADYSRALLFQTRTRRDYPSRLARRTSFRHRPVPVVRRKVRRLARRSAATRRRRSLASRCIVCVCSGRQETRYLVPRSGLEGHEKVVWLFACQIGLLAGTWFFRRRRCLCVRVCECWLRSRAARCGLATQKLSMASSINVTEMRLRNLAHTSLSSRRAARPSL